MLDFIILFSVAYFIFSLVMLWQFAIKTGREGWELYIPIYSQYVLLNIAGMDIYWFILCLIPTIVIYVLHEYLIIVVLSYIFAIILSFMFCVSLANKFNKGIGFAFGLFFLNPIFMAILTFDKKCIYNK